MENSPQIDVEKVERVEKDVEKVEKARELAKWDEKSTECLISAYRSWFLGLNRGNLEGKHWTKIAEEIQDSCSWLVERQQCKQKMENLKRRYKIEKDIKHSAGSGTCSWKYFELLDEFLNTTPKVLGIPRRIERGLETFRIHLENSESEADMTEEPITGDITTPKNIREVIATKGTGEDTTQKNHPGEFTTPKNTGDFSIPTNTVDITIPRITGGEASTPKNTGEVSTPEITGQDVPGVSARRSSGKKRKRLSGLGSAFREGIQSFADVFSRIEVAKIQANTELEIQKMQLQRELEKDRREAEYRQLELQVQLQLEIAKILKKSRLQM